MIWMIHLILPLILFHWNAKMNNTKNINSHKCLIWHLQSILAWGMQERILLFLHVAETAVHCFNFLSTILL